MKTKLTNLSKLRKLSGYKQKDFAQLLNVKPITVSQWEIGRRCPNIFLLKRISDLLHCQIEDLL